MSKKSLKPKKNDAAALLELLKSVLPKAALDPALAELVYAAVERELMNKSRALAFDKYCERMELPDLEATTLAEVQQQLATSFGGGDVTIQPNPKEKSLAVEVSLPDGTQLVKEIRVRPVSKDAETEPEVTLKFVPFPVSLPGDPELIWSLAKRENLTADEAAIALTKSEENFWGSKFGQKLLQDRVERSFPEFIARAPAGALTEAGLKRHYKTPEPVKILRRLKV
jgi:hypothetical protein